MITRRCTQRQFLLRPDEETNNAFIYCLGEAAERFEIDVIETDAESKHHHTQVFDRHGRFPMFMEHFHKMVARAMNALRGRSENFWSSEEPCVTTVLDKETMIEKLIYIAINPVKDGLVERVHHWPGVNTYKNLVSGRVLRAKRPRFFFRDGGKMPEEVVLRMTVPPELGTREEIVARVKAGVEAYERRAAEERMRTGKRVLGRKRVLKQSWKACAVKEEPRRNLRPRFSGRPTECAIALLGYKAFVCAYRDARLRWLAKQPAQFPPGTYWLARFAAIPIAPTSIRGSPPTDPVVAPN
jgi:hypothetical protein